MLRAMVILLAHGAGAASSSTWMIGWKKRLATIAPTTSFDYRYMREHRRAPDPLPKLIATHREALAAALAKHSAPAVLALKVPILFVQGTRDPLCPLDLLEGVRTRMQVASRLYTVEGADHSLIVSAAARKASGQTQDD